MSLTRLALFSLLLSPLALASNSKPETAGDMQFHSLRSAATQKSHSGSLKPKLPQAQYVPIEMSLRLHSHADGTQSMACDVEHAKEHSTSRDAAETSAAEAQP